jgi:hypothetical protein
VLFVSLQRCPPQITKAFTDFKLLGIDRVTLVKARTRDVHFCRLAGYRGAGSEAP